MIKKILLAGTVLLLAGNAYAQDASKEFIACYNKAGSISEDAMAACYNDESKRLLQEIKVLYEDASKTDILAKWSGGQGMQRGNLRTMFETWVNYRNIYCSYYAVGKSNYLGSSAYNNAECVHKMTMQHYNDIRSVLIDATSVVYPGDS